MKKIYLKPENAIKFFLYFKITELIDNTRTSVKMKILTLMKVLQGTWKQNLQVYQNDPKCTLTQV